MQQSLPRPRDDFKAGRDGEWMGHAQQPEKRKEQEPETTRSSLSGAMYQAVQADEQDVSAVFGQIKVFPPKP